MARLRPILMPALIAILVLLPLTLGLGQGAELQKPLAVAIISGLIAGVPMVLLLLPLVLRALSTNRARRLRGPKEANVVGERA